MNADPNKIPGTGLTSIVATVKVEGFHNWPGAREQHQYLCAEHRHLFHIRVEKRVKYANREIEIIEFGRKVTNELEFEFGRPCDFGPLSCEHIAHWLTNQFDLDRCEVMEDGENGAIVEVIR